MPCFSLSTMSFHPPVPRWVNSTRYGDWKVVEALERELEELEWKKVLGQQFLDQLAYLALSFIFVLKISV